MIVGINGRFEGGSAHGESVNGNAIRDHVQGANDDRVEHADDDSEQLRFQNVRIDGSCKANNGSCKTNKGVSWVDVVRRRPRVEKESSNAHSYSTLPC